MQPRIQKDETNKLKGLTFPWTIDTRPNDGTVYDDNSILRLPGRRTSTYERILEYDTNIITKKNLKGSRNTKL